MTRNINSKKRPSKRQTFRGFSGLETKPKMANKNRNLGPDRASLLHYIGSANTMLAGQGQPSVESWNELEATGKLTDAIHTSSAAPQESSPQCTQMLRDHSVPAADIFYITL